MVIAIIAILAGLLLPALSKTKSGNRTVCLNNIKQLLLSTHLYAGDQQDYLPYTSWVPGPSMANWAYTRITTSKPDHTVGAAQLWPSPIVFCPLDRTNTALFRQREDEGVQLHDEWGGVAYGTAPGQYTTYKLAQFAPDAMIFWEADEKQPSNYDNVASRPDEGVTQRSQHRHRDGEFFGATPVHAVKSILSGGGRIPQDSSRPLLVQPGSKTGD